MTDDEWVAMGLHADSPEGDEAYYDDFQRRLGLDLRDVG